MDYYDSRANVEAYIRMADGFDGKALVEALRKYLPPGSSVLELGMGPGKDLLMLTEHYRATGSDRSAIFVERFRQRHPQPKVFELDAVSIDTAERYAALYSNKALSHLTPDELRLSFARQAQVLDSNGLALHSFWHGDGACEHQGLRFVYYSEDTLKGLHEPHFDSLESKRYSEIETDDSFYVVLRRR